MIEETIREKLPEGFQKAEYLLQHGMVDMVVPRGELRATLIRILGLLRKPQPKDEPEVLAAAAELPPLPVVLPSTAIGSKGNGKPGKGG